MSSLRNAVKRKTHKERAQPVARSKYGLLEKKKDYVARAKDFHRKEDTIRTLKEKAEFRNDDEFYFGMEHERTKDGVHIGKSKDGKYTQEELLLMKSQDVGYLRTKAQAEAKKVERLQESLHFIGATASNQHTVFVDDAAAARDFDAAAHFDTPAELLGRTFNRPRTAQLEAGEAAEGIDQLPKGLDRKRRARYNELLQRAERQAKLAKLADKLAFDKQLMGKGKKTKIKAKDGEPASYRWRQERKK